MTAPTAHITTDPALEAALAWAGTDDDRWQSDVLAAFVQLVRALDAYQEEHRHDD